RDSRAERLVLPNANDCPALVSERGVVSCVALAVSANLRRPIARVRAWLDAMLRAAVPKAAVDEHRDACSREDDVWSRRRATRSKLEVDTKAQTAPMQGRAQRELRPRVALAVAL